MRVLVNGLGNIGGTITQLLAKYKSEFSIEEILVHKRTQNAWNKADIQAVENLGVTVLSTEEYNAEKHNVHYIFEATPNGIGVSNQEEYQNLSNLIGASAQGSEKGFGIPFISGVNDDLVRGQKMVHVVSCNTHGTAALLQLFGGKDLSNIEEADVVVVRRSEDISNHQRLVSGNVIARHLDPDIGTHHAIDVIDLYKTLGIACNLTSSDITTPSQFLHTVRFNFKLKTPIDLNNELDFIGTTNKFDSNVVFEMGRRFGFAGRLYNHAILVKSNIMNHGNMVKGWAFVPQEGNTIISTLHAFLLQTNHKSEKQLIEMIKKDLVIKEL